MDRYVLTGHADVASANFSLFDQPASHKFCGVTRDRETDSLSRTNHRRVDADHFAGGIHERPTRVTRIQSGIGLNDIVDQTAGLRVHGTAERADHARGNASLKAKRVPDRDHDLADAQVL